LRDVVDPKRPVTYGIVQPGPRYEGGVPIIRGQDYSSGEVDSSSLYYVHPSVASPYKRATVKGGDVLLSIVGYVGLTAQVPESLTGANLTQTTARIAIQSNLESRYFLHYFRGNRFRQEICRYTKGSAQPGLNLGDVEVFKVDYPPLPEQRRIAEILDTLDEVIRKTEQVIAKTQQMKQGLLHDLLTRGIDENGELRDPERHPEQFKDSPLGRIPVAWEDPMKMGELEEQRSLELGRGSIISSVDIGNCPGTYPIYSSSAKGDGEFGRYGKYMFEEELITWSVDGGGRPFYRSLHRFSVTNVCGYLRITRQDQWDYRFVYSLMAFQHAAIRFDYQMKAHPSVIRDLYLFPRPGLSEQRRIVAVLISNDAHTAQEKTYLEKLMTLKKGLMDDLLTGRVRAPVESEAAAA
jgi:type I restriction enzyme S subunit